MPVQFSYSSTTFNIQNPVFSNLYKIKKFQALARTAGGKIFAYDKGVTSYQLTLEFSDLRQSEKDDLESFFDSVVNGTLTDFEYTDHFGTVWSAKFLVTELSFEEVDNEGSRLSFPFISDGETYPSNRFVKGVYKVSFDLEVWSS